MNLAGVWKLPVVFICENNQYGISLHVSKSVAADDIADRAAGYGMPGVVVDGNDVLACYEVAENAIRIARKGGGPSLIEAKTYRLRGHFEGDSQSYRTTEEVEIAKKREPVGRFTKALLEAKVLSAQDVEKYDAEATQELEAAFKYAEDLPTIPIEAMMETLKG
jgi:pyruvate dehydrogenase E1 component alpha subunit